MAHPDFDELLNVLLPFAKKMLAEYGSFHPFGAVMESDGKSRMVGAKVEGNEFPKAVDLIQILEAEFHKNAEEGTIKASGICFDVRVIPPGGQEKTDAVQVNLEYVGGETFAVFLPYKKSIFKKISYGELFSRSESAQNLANFGK
jgi:hypothetical protein